MRVAHAGLAVASVLLPFQLAAGAVIELSNGGRVVGEVLNPQESPRKTWIVKTADGGRVTLSSSQVKRVLYPRPEQIEYERMRPRYPDTVEGHWALVEWCGEHRLLAQRKSHLERIIQQPSSFWRFSSGILL